MNHKIETTRVTLELDQDEVIELAEFFDALKGKVASPPVVWPSVGAFIRVVKDAAEHWRRQS